MTIIRKNFLVKFRVSNYTITQGYFNKGWVNVKKQLKDIAYFESSVPIEIGSKIPEELGEIYDFSAHSDIIGHKFALLLHGAGFSINDCEQVLINFTPALAKEVFEVSERRLQRWQCFVNAGLQPESVKAIPLEEKRMLLVALTEKVLKECFAENLAEQKQIHEAAREIVMYGEKLEIPYLQKNDKNFDVTVALNLLNDGSARVILTIRDKQGSVISKREIAQCQSYDEAVNQAGSILVRKNRIVVKPKNNLNAKEVSPIEIILDEE